MIPEEGSPGLCAVGSGGPDGAGAAAIPSATIAGSKAGDCCPKCAVLGRENNESPEPVLAMAIDRDLTADNLSIGSHSYNK